MLFMSRGKLSEQILQILKREHLASASAVLELLEKSGQHYNKTSVYRALERLMASEQICRTSLGKSEIYYELRYDDHAHLVCNYCGGISVYEMPVQSDLAGFRPEHSHITIFGICKNCQETSETQETHEQ